MPRPSVRPRLLEAAGTLIATHGVADLTLDRVADAGGVSKGGLLYHFPTKADLVEALVLDILDGFEQAVDALAADAPAPAAWAHAYVDATFDAEVSRPAVAASLMNAPEVAGGLLRRCAERLTAWQRRLEADGLDPATAAMVRYACDGWWALASLVPEADADAAALRARLHGLIHEATG